MSSVVIFDLDGTLINSIEDLADAVNKALLDCGFPTHEVEKYNYFVGDGAGKLISRAIPDGEKTEENIKAVSKNFSENYGKSFAKKTYVYDGILKLLEDLKNAGFSLAVASNKPDEFTKVIVNKLFKPQTFDIVRGHIDGVLHKPDPQIVFNIIDELGSDKSTSFFIGDTNVDIKTAQNSGIKSIGCQWGFRGRDELLKSGADFIAQHPSDILDIIKKESNFYGLQH